MLIEEIFPDVIQRKSILQSRFVLIAQEQGFSHEDIQTLVNTLPPALQNAGCFLYRLTNLWRYEFGLPYKLANDEKYMWGTHMWIPLKYLIATTICACHFLSQEQQRHYFSRLANPKKHRDFLAEMRPMWKIERNLNAAYEV